MWQDMIKGVLEISGAFIILFNIFRIVKDKDLKGVSFWYIFFSVITNGYAVYFYWVLGQWYAFWGVAVYTILVIIWLLLALIYKGIK